MVVILKDGATKADAMEMIEYLDAYNVSVSVTEGQHTTILGLVGDTVSLDPNDLLAFDVVADVKRIQEPYRLQTRSSILSRLSLM